LHRQKQVGQLLLRKSWSYGVVWNSRDAFWWRPFQTWKVWRFTCSQYFNAFARWKQRRCGSRGGEFEGIESVYGLKVVKSC